MAKRIIIDELEFDVAYGKLCAKSWHEDTDDCKRILALHGWMDNAGSFDNLAPLITDEKGVYIVALDLPGHGKSSQLPQGTSYTDLGMIMEIRRCIMELEWNTPERKFTIMGHSLGAGLGLFYSSLFPSDVDGLILLDFLKSSTYSLEKLCQNTAEAIDQFIYTVPCIASPMTSPVNLRANKTGGNSSPFKANDRGNVTVSQQAALQATKQAHSHLGDLTDDNCACLLRRSTVAVSHPPNSVIYKRDLRLQCMLNFRDHIECNMLMFGMCRCSIVSILCKTGLYRREQFEDNIEAIQELFQKNSKSFSLEWIDGDHYVHMNDTSAILGVINKFLSKL